MEKSENSNNINLNKPNSEIQSESSEKEQNISNIDKDPFLNEKYLDRYKDPEGLTVRKMNIGLWFIYHREQINRLFFGFVFLCGTISWLFFFYAFGHYILIGRGESRIAQNEIITMGLPDHNFFLSQAAKELLFTPTQIIRGSGGNYDFITQIKNPNKRYIADFDYYFTDGHTKTKIKKGFIYPLEGKYFATIGQPLNGQFSGYHIQLENLSWRRTNAHLYGDWEKFKKSRLNVLVSDVKFLPGESTRLTENIKLSQLDFSVNNQSSFSYWEMPFLIFLLRGSDIMGVNRYVLENFQTGEKREVSMIWPGNFFQITDIRIIPDLDITDKAVYTTIKYKTKKEKYR